MGLMCNFFFQSFNISLLGDYILNLQKGIYHHIAINLQRMNQPLRIEIGIQSIFLYLCLKLLCSLSIEELKDFELLFERPVLNSKSIHLNLLGLYLFF